MKRLLPLLVLCGSLATAGADLILEQQIESSAQNGKLTVKIKGEKVRMDMPSGPVGPMSMIIDTVSGDALTLIHAQKMAMKISGAQTRQAMEAMQKFGASGVDPKAPEPKLEATGKTEKIGEYDTELYLWSASTGKQTLWVAKDFPNYARIRPQLEKLTKAAAASIGGKNKAPDIASLPGMVVKSEAEAQGQKIVSTLISLKEDPVEPAALEKPADYQEMQQPKLPGAN